MHARTAEQLHCHARGSSCRAAELWAPTAILAAGGRRAALLPAHCTACARPGHAAARICTAARPALLPRTHTGRTRTGCTRALAVAAQSR